MIKDQPKAAATVVDDVIKTRQTKSTLKLFLCIRHTHTHTHTHMCVCVCVCIYI